MRIAIIGAGDVGGTLGRRWAELGHSVIFGSRDPSSARLTDLLEKSGENASAKSLSQAAAEGEVVVLATPWPAAEEALRAAGDLRGKPLLDCTNPLKPDLSGLAVGQTTSAAEQIAGWAKGARVVKIFNTTGFPNMADPRFGGVPATMFYAGDDAGAKAIAGKLAAELGFEPVDAGPLRQARLLEPLAMLWISLAFGQKLGTGIAFKLLRR